MRPQPISDAELGEGDAGAVAVALPQVPAGSLCAAQSAACAGTMFAAPSHPLQMLFALLPPCSAGAASEEDAVVALNLTVSAGVVCSAVGVDSGALVCLVTQ